MECIKCHEYKELNQFHKNGNSYRRKCRECRSEEEKARYEKDKERIKANVRAYYEKTWEKQQEKNRNWRTRSDEEKEANREERAKEVKREPVTEPFVHWNKRNPERAKAIHEAYKPTLRARMLHRRKTDRVYAMIQSMRGRLCALVTEKYKLNMDMGMKHDQVRHWIEYQFDDKMNWQNYGKYWHLDHVVSVKLFDENDVKLHSCNWANLRPLERAENIRKGDKITPDIINTHKALLAKFIQDNPGYQAAYENSWWPRFELGDGNNSKVEDAKQALRWAIRSEGSKAPVIRRIKPNRQKPPAMSNVQRLDGDGFR